MALLSFLPSSSFGPILLGPGPTAHIEQLPHRQKAAKPGPGEQGLSGARPLQVSPRDALAVHLFQCEEKPTS